MLVQNYHQNLIDDGKLTLNLKSLYTNNQFQIMSLYCLRMQKYSEHVQGILELSLDDGLAHDTEIIARNREIIRSNRMLLSMASSVLATLLHKDSTEEINLILPETEKSIVKKFIQIISTGNTCGGGSQIPKIITTFNSLGIYNIIIQSKIRNHRQEDSNYSFKLYTNPPSISNEFNCPVDETHHRTIISEERGEDPQINPMRKSRHIVDTSEDRVAIPKGLLSRSRFKGSIEDLQTALTMIQNGHSIIGASNLLGIPRSTIKDWMVKLNIVTAFRRRSLDNINITQEDRVIIPNELGKVFKEKNKMNYSLEDLETALTFVKLGHSITSTGNRMGISKNVIRKWLKKLNINTHYGNNATK